MESDPLEDRVRDALERGDVPTVYAAANDLRPRLERAVSLRMDPRLAGRVTCSDVLQDTYLELGRRLPSYVEEPVEDQPGRRGRMPFFLWVRFLALQKLQEAYRVHMQAEVRDVRRQRTLDSPPSTEASAAGLALALTQSGVTASKAVAQSEVHQLLAEALENLAPADRDVLVMRHFEQLRNADVARLLEISGAAASMRYATALKRLRRVLESVGVTLSAALG